MNEYQAFVAENFDGETEKTGWYELRRNGAIRFSSIECRHFKKQTKHLLGRSG